MKTRLFFAIAFICCSISLAQTKAIRSEIIGKGDPIIFLPGFTNPGSIWTETINELNSKFEAHLISYAGFNGIPPVETPWYSKVKKDLINYVKYNNLQEFVIIGHSMGGNLAVEIAAELPKEVKKVILVDALPCMREVMMPNIPVSKIQYDSPYNSRTLKMNSEQFKAMATSMADNMTDNITKKGYITQCILEADRKTYVYGYTDLLKLDLRPKLSKIEAEVLILAAPAYGAMALENMKIQYANLTNKTVEMAPKGKHFVMFDNEDWFYKRVNSFLFSEK